MDLHRRGQRVWVDDGDLWWQAAAVEHDASLILGAECGHEEAGHHEGAAGYACEVDVGFVEGYVLGELVLDEVVHSLGVCYAVGSLETGAATPETLVILWEFSSACRKFPQFIPNEMTKQGGKEELTGAWTTTPIRLS